MGWTEDQKKAIYTDTGTGNLLVSAAAGSGKTAVLVERILQKIINGKTTIDRLLIVTFTEAAASEMREKIIKRLSEYLAEANDKKFIKSQIRLTESADIMTIDAFCSRVVKNNFHALGIEPNFGVADESTASLMKNEVMEALFERLYKSTDPEISARLNRLTDFYAKDRSNDALAEIVFSIYKFTESFPDPEKWLSDAVKAYSLPPMEQPTVKFHENYTRSVAERYLNEIKGLTEITDKIEEFKQAKEKLEKKNEADLNWADKLHISLLRELVTAYEKIAYSYDIIEECLTDIVNAEDYDEIYEVYTRHFDKPKKRENLIELANCLESVPGGETVKSIILGLCDIFTAKSKTPMGVTRSSEYINNFYASGVLKTEGEDIEFLFKEFMHDYRAAKDEKGVYEFSDIEHLTYELFSQNEQIRSEYSNKYDEIMIDEYQDTNLLQDTVFSLISHNNIFMVGDLKQSIYRFRKGDPYIFKSKASEYRKPESPHTLITLSQNFRSRQEVLKGVNGIFTAVMSENAGDVDYSGDELIIRNEEYEYYPAPTSDCTAELHYLAPSKENGLDHIRCEAEFTARKIAELLASGTEVYDKTLGKMRKIQKRDIVILQSTLKYNGDILAEELSRYGINSYIDRGSFFDRREVTVMLSLLSVIDNMHRDIPLIAAMRSPIGGFSDDELAMIRIGTTHSGDFITAVRQYIKYGENGALKSRLHDFVTSIYRWRGYLRKKSVSQLIWTIYEETCFYDIMGAIEEGEEAQTNLRLLYERAKQFENGGARGLFNFLKYMEQVEEHPKEMGGAKLIGENHDVVRVMTIHKSKGLEFPYVFLLGMGRMFPSDNNQPLMRMHKDLGLALPQIDYDKHYARKTHAYELISAINHAETISEQMRLLYVAMTRPKEKLYAVVCIPRTSEQTAAEIISEYKSGFTGKMRPEEALSAKGFYGWICPAACASKDWKVFSYDIDSISDADPTPQNEDYDTFKDSEELRESVYSLLDYEYPAAECFTIPSRTSVTQLKELAQLSEDTVYEPDSRRQTDITELADLMLSPLHQKPAFMSEDGKRRANEIGTLYHFVMSKIDLEAAYRNGAGSEIERLAQLGDITEDDLKYIDIKKIDGFFKSELAQRMLKSDNINRERPFQINISARQYDPSLSEKYENETVILQGIIDCFFEEDGGFVLFDYKTDKVKNNQAEIKKRYQKQLELYSDAIERLTGKRVKECYLYLFDSGETI